MEVTLPGRRWDELAAAETAVSLLSSSGRPTIWTVPLDVQGTPLADIAAGRGDDAWARLARTVARKDGQAVIRLQVPARSSPDHAAAAFRRAATAIRRTPGVAVEWSIPPGTDPAAATAAWPGPDVVDVIGVEVSPRRTWAATVAGRGGLADWAAWARDHGKRVAIHWTLDERTSATDVERVADWLHHSAGTSILAYDGVDASPHAEASTLGAYRALW